MSIDDQNHASVSPAEMESLLFQDRRLLINGTLIPSTPIIFAERRDFDRFLEWLSDQFRVHPRNFVIRGSTLLGYSMTPLPAKVWTSYTDRSDIDLAIVDADYYHVFDREIHRLETRPLGSAEASTDTTEKRNNRKRDRKFYCYKYFDLPNLPAVVQQTAALQNVPAYLLDRPRPVKAFVYRDWWSLFDRWDWELRSLEDGVRQGRLQHGTEQPR